MYVPSLKVDNGLIRLKGLRQEHNARGKPSLTILAIGLFRHGPMQARFPKYPTGVESFVRHIN